MAADSPQGCSSQLKYLWQTADAPTMGNDFHASNADLPVLPPTPLRLVDEAAGLTPTATGPTGPRPITISPPSSLSTAGATQTMRPESTSHHARTVPIASPSADMSTPPTGVPRVPPTLPSAPPMPTLPTLPTLPTATAGAAAPVTSPLPLLEPELVEVVQAVVDQEESRFVTDAPQHPMAHLMPTRTKPTEAQVRANEMRASNKRKTRRAKALVVVGVVALGALGGPPLATWVVDAVNESGTTTDRTKSSSNDGVSDNTGSNAANPGVGVLLEDIGTLTSVVAENTDNIENTENTAGG